MDNTQNATTTKLNDKLKKMTSYFLSVCIVAIRRLFCDEFNEKKNYGINLYLTWKY